MLFRYEKPHSALVNSLIFFVGGRKLARTQSFPKLPDRMRRHFAPEFRRRNPEFRSNIRFRQDFFRRKIDKLVPIFARLRRYDKQFRRLFLQSEIPASAICKTSPSKPSSAIKTLLPPPRMKISNYFLRQNLTL